MTILATIVLLAETLTYFPGNDLIPGTVVSSSGKTAVVHSIPGGKSIQVSEPTAVAAAEHSWHRTNGFYCPEQAESYWNKPMPKFKGDKKCSICRGRGKLGRNDCKCVRKQQEAWKKDREAVLKANPQLKGSK